MIRLDRQREGLLLRRTHSEHNGSRKKAEKGGYKREMTRVDETRWIGLCLKGWNGSWLHGMEEVKWKV
jgi:hypothetical protein